MTPMRPLPSRFLVVLLLAATAVAGAAEQPLGLVDKVDGSQLTVHFDAGVALPPGVVVAIFGPGKITKHPLTKEVITEQRQLVAKAQVLSGAGGVYVARLAWAQADTTVAAGMDVVPLPAEAAPNAPPVLTAQPAEVSCPLQGAVKIQLPISDPDGDEMSFTWSIDGASGRVGRLAARVTRQPEVVWLAPGTATTATLKVVARDRLGQELTVSVKLNAVALDDEWRKREIQVFSRQGGEDKRLTRLKRDAAGFWWAKDSYNDKVVRIAPGWMSETAFAPAAEVAPRKPLVVLPWRGQVYVLDGSLQTVLVFGADGVLKRKLGQGSRATDLAIADDGTVFIADQGAGGVLVYENDGRFRACLGHPGKGPDAFAGLSRIALGPGGELYALDPEQRMIQRFDRFQRRLDTWEIQGDAKNIPIDLAAHGRGLLALMASGQILIFNTKGVASESMPALAESRLADSVGAPDSLTVDADGEIYVAYAESGLIARYSAAGQVTGVRGPSLWNQGKYVADGSGRIYGLNTDNGLVYAYDGEDWRTAWFGGNARQKGPFSEAAALAVTPDGTGLVVLDTDKNNLLRFSTAAPQDKPLVFGQTGKNNGQFTKPIALAIDEDGRTYVLDAGLHRVVVFDAKGGFLFNVGRYERGKLADELVEPTLLAVSAAGDALYVYDADRYEVKKFTLDQKAQQGAHVTNAGGKGDGPGQIRRLVGLGCDRVGLIYLLDSSRNDLQILDFRGSNAVAVFARKFADLGLRRAELLTVAADGQAYLGQSTDVVGVRW